MDRSPLSPMFNPESVAVFGASESKTSVGGRVFSNILRAGYGGELIPVNPKYESVHGMTCVPDISRLARPADLAVIATPAAVVVVWRRRTGAAIC